VRLAKIFLIATIIAGTVFGSFGSFVDVKKAEAKPPTPGQATLTFAFTSTKRQGIMMRYVSSTGATPVDFDFVSSGYLVEPGQSVDTHVGNSVYAAIRRAGTNNYYLKYSNSANSDFFLLIGMNATNTTDPNKPVGTYYALGVGKMSEVGIGGSKRFVYDSGFKTPDGTDVAPFINQTVISTAIKINWNISLDNACSQLTARWEGLVSNMRDLLGKETKDNSTYWDKNSPPGWRKAMSASTIATTLAVNPFLSLFAIGGTALLDRMSKYDGSYFLNEAGMRKASDIRTEIIELKAITEQIKGDGNVWPNDNCRPKALDGTTISLINNRFIATPNDFIAGLDIILEAFNEAIANASGTDETDTCGPGLTKIAVIFQWMFCKVAEMVHAIANFFMSKAFSYLNLALGIDAIKFSAPKLDTKINDISTTGGSTLPSTPGTTTPATPGTTTAAPLSLEVRMTMQGETVTEASNYEIFKANYQTGIWAKIKKSDGSAQKDCTVSNVGNFSDANKTVDLKFNTPDNIPTDWTSVVIWGGIGNAGNAILFRFPVTQYPGSITGRTNVTSNPQ